MFSDIVDLRSFYLSPLGMVARRLLRQKLLRCWPALKGETMVALGYATPLLRPYLEQGARVAALMPAGQGAVFWPKEEPNRTGMVDVFNLPLADNSVDRILLLHAAEGCGDNTALLREAWRVLKSGGRLLAVVPNRRGVWAMGEVTPFGHGQPFSPSQFKALLRDNHFMPEGVSRALYLPPWSWGFVLRMADFLEYWGARLFPTLGGVLYIEASKQLYAPVRPALARREPLALPAGIILPGADTPAPTSRQEL